MMTSWARLQSNHESSSSLDTSGKILTTLKDGLRELCTLYAELEMGILKLPHIRRATQLSKQVEHRAAMQ